MADSYAKIVQGSATGTPLPVTGSGLSGAVPVYSPSTVFPIFTVPTDAGTTILTPKGSPLRNQLLMAQQTLLGGFTSSIFTNLYGDGAFIWWKFLNPVGATPGVRLTCYLQEVNTGLKQFFYQSAFQTSTGQITVAIYPGPIVAGQPGQSLPLGPNWNFVLDFQAGTTSYDCAVAVSYCF